MPEQPPARATYARPAIVRMGSVVELTKKFNQNDICDGPPCNGNWRNFTTTEGGTADPKTIVPDHDHDPAQPLVNPK